MPSLPPVTFVGTKAVFDLGSGQKLYAEITNMTTRDDFVSDTDNPSAEQMTMVYRWLKQRGYTLQSMSQSASQRNAYASATYTITLSA